MQDESTLREVAKDCVHCGFCLPACPTYQLWAEEMDSPRGRIYLVNQILDGAELSGAAAEHFDRCLGCMACMTACPSGVQYDQLIEAARVWTEEARAGGVAGRRAGPADERGRPERGAGQGAGRPRRRADHGQGRCGTGSARTAIFSLFPYPRRLRALTAPLRLAQRTGLHRRVARSRLPGRVSPSSARRCGWPRPVCPRPRRARCRAGCPRSAPGARWWACSPAASSRFSSRRSTPRRRVCSRRRAVTWSSRAGRAAAARCHCTRAGRRRPADFARRTIATFEQAGVDAVVVNSAGCGSAMKEYERLLRRAPTAAGPSAPPR